MRHFINVASIAVFCLLLIPIAANAVDPTMPLFLQKPAPKIAKPAPKPEKYIVTSTLVSNGRRVAIINNSVVGVGDKVGSAIVTDITQTAVVLSRAGRTVTVLLENNNIKKSAVRVVAPKQEDTHE